MKERPILFSSTMVRAILDGRKSMTRRIVKANTGIINGGSEWPDFENFDLEPYEILKFPYRVGDHLWVRETFYDYNIKPVDEPIQTEIVYRADRESENFNNVKWRPSIYMPRRYSRIMLEITNVMVERLQDITEADAMREGDTKQGLIASENTHRDWFRMLWDSINEKRGYGWNKNPWVWVIEFKRI